MDSFLKIHQATVVGTVSTFDRMIFKGHLTGFYPRGSLRVFLWRQGVPLKDFGGYVEKVTRTLKEHAQRMAEQAGRPFRYLESATTKRSGASKEDLAREIAARDGIDTGLVCVFSVLEPCKSFAVQGNRTSHRLEVLRRQRKCLHFYFYILDPEFGLIHIRLQSWFPFEIQVYVNGRAWLAQQLEKAGIAYDRCDNAFTWIEDLPAAHKLCERFARRRWPRVLNALARRANPFLSAIREAGFGEYYWVLDQGEYATDVMFRSRQTLEGICGDLMEAAITKFGADDVLRFLGRKLRGNFQGEVTTDLKRRLEGRRVKHWMKRNSIKMYDKGSVLRIKTTINNPREFKVLRVFQTRSGRSRRCYPIGKGVANIWRYAQVSLQANQRYLEAHAHVHPKGKAVAELDRLCRPRTMRGTRYARFNPITRDDSNLFLAVLAGEHVIGGFRSGDIQTRIFGPPAASKPERQRRSARTSRLLAKLRAHGLIAKVPGCRRYHVTARGHRVMSAAIHYRNNDFPQALLEAA